MSAAPDINAAILEELRAIRAALESGNRDLLTRQDAAKRLGMDRTRFGALVKAGLIRSVPHGAGSRIPREEVERIARDGVPKPRKAGRPRKVQARTGDAIRAVPIPISSSARGEG